MKTLPRNLFIMAVTTVLMIPALTSAASVTIQNLSSASPLAKTIVTFGSSVSGFETPYYQISDSFPNSSIQSSNINFGGNFQWVPNLSDIGTHTLTLRVTDSNGNQATATQIINVLPPPSISIQSVSPGASVMPGNTYSFTISAPGFVNPTYTVSDTFSGSSVSNNTISSSGMFSWKPDATQNGDHAITVYAYDAAGNNAQATTVVRVGSGPSLSVPSGLNTTISQGQTISFTLSPAGYTPNGFSLADTFSGVTSVSNSNITAGGLFTWTPTAADAGVHSVMFTGQVGSFGQKATTTVVINVLGANGQLPGVPATTATSSGTTSSTLSDLQKQIALLQSQLGTAKPSTPSVPVGSNYIFTSYLKSGSESDEVLELQKVLARLGFLKVEPNGYFGPSTLAAVKKFQASRGLDQLGAVGPGTRLELNSLTSAGVETQTVPTTASASSYNFNHFMGIGDDDESEVIELQKKLIALGFLKTEPTGYFGAGTEAAVKKFQAKHGIPQTGYLNKKTRAVLNAQ